MDRVYKIKTKLKFPMILSSLLSIPVFIDVVLKGHETSVMFMAILLMVLFYLITINNLLRKIHITNELIKFRGILGIKNLAVSEISFIDAVNMGNKQFISISSSKKQHLIPNSFDNFKDIILELEKIIPKEKIGEGISSLKENIVERKSDVKSAWAVVVVLVVIILIRIST